MYQYILAGSRGSIASVSRDERVIRHPEAHDPCAGLLFSAIQREGKRKLGGVSVRGAGYAGRSSVKGKPGNQVLTKSNKVMWPKVQCHHMVMSQYLTHRHSGTKISKGEETGYKLSSTSIYAPCQTSRPSATPLQISTGPNSRRTDRLPSIKAATPIHPADPRNGDPYHAAIDNTSPSPTIHISTKPPAFK